MRYLETKIEHLYLYFNVLFEIKLNQPYSNVIEVRKIELNSKHIFRL